MTHTIICHSAVPWCHTGHQVLSAFYPTQSLNGNDMTLASCDATVSYAASRQGDTAAPMTASNGSRSSIVSGI